MSLYERKALAESMSDIVLIQAIREALLAANEDVYGDGGNAFPLAALDEALTRLLARRSLT